MGLSSIPEQLVQLGVIARVSARTQAGTKRDRQWNNVAKTDVVSVRSNDGAAGSQGACALEF